MRGRKRIMTLAQAGAAALAALSLTLPIAAEAQQRPRSFQQTPPPGDGRPSPHQTRPLPEIVASVQATPPFNGMDYIGVAGFDTRSMVYALRFLSGRQVVVVFVDARTGRILRSEP